MAETPQVVAVTGAAGYLGRRLVARLQEEPTVQKVLGIDLRPMEEPLPKLYFTRHDVTQPLDGLFREHGVEAVVHLAFVLRQGRNREAVHRINVGGTENVLHACRAARVRRIVYFSSTTVYGSHPDNPIPLTEESPTRPPYAFQYAWDKAETEKLLARYAQEVPDARLTVLRGCVVMGPTASNFITRAFFKPILVGIRGADPPLQFLHEADLTDLLVWFLQEGRPGLFNVAGPGEVRYSQMVRMARRPLVWLPAFVAYPLTELTWRLRLQNDSPAVGLDFIRYSWVASTEKLRRETGFAFKHTSEEALRSYLEARG